MGGSSRHRRRVPRRDVPTRVDRYPSGDGDAAARGGGYPRRVGTDMGRSGRARFRCRLVGHRRLERDRQQGAGPVRERHPDDGPGSCRRTGPGRTSCSTRAALQRTGRWRCRSRTTGPERRRCGRPRTGTRGRRPVRRRARRSGWASGAAGSGSSPTTAPAAAGSRCTSSRRPAPGATWTDRSATRRGLWSLRSPFPASPQSTTRRVRSRSRREPTGSRRPTRRSLPGGAGSGG